jgi:hypothetical protein
VGAVARKDDLDGGAGLIVRRRSPSHFIQLCQWLIFYGFSVLLPYIVVMRQWMRHNLLKSLARQRGIEALFSL